MSRGKSPVAIVPCPDYEPATVAHAVAEILDLLPEMRDALPEGCEVLLKINLTQICPPDLGVCTHPEVLRQFALALQAQGVGIRIGEGSGTSGWAVHRKLHKVLFERLEGTFAGKRYRELLPYHDRIQNLSSYYEAFGLQVGGFDVAPVTLDELGVDTVIDFFKLCGILDVAQELGARLDYLDLEKAVTVRSPTGLFLRELPVCSPVLVVDRVISMPKMKTHADQLITGAIKNFFGNVPTPMRSTYHTTSQFAGMMGEMLIDVFSVMRPAPFALTDAVVGMEGCGPLEGPTRHFGHLIASTDCIAHDAVQAVLMGVEPTEVPVVKVGDRCGLGNGRMENIEVRGVSVKRAFQGAWNLDRNLKADYGWNQWRRRTGPL